MPEHIDRSDSFVIETDEALRALHGVTGGLWLGGTDYFPLIAYSIADRQASMYLERHRFAGLRTAVVPLMSLILRKAGIGEEVACNETGLGSADIVIASGFHRSDRLGDQQLDMPIGPLNSALQAAGFTTAMLAYSTPKGSRGSFRRPIRLQSRQARSALRGIETALRSWSGVPECIEIMNRSLRLPTRLHLESMARLMRLTDKARQTWIPILESCKHAVIVCGGINPVTAGCILAAHQLSLKTFEFQHGYLRIFDPRLTGLNLQNSVTAPQFLSWTAMPESPASFASATIGAPYAVMRQVCALSPSSPLCRALERTNRMVRGGIEGLERPIGLVTLQPGVDIHEAAVVVAEKKGIKTLLWRNHPRMTRDKAGELDRLANEVPLGILLPYVDLHITYSSASSLEAYDAGVPTLFLSNLGRMLLPTAMHPPPKVEDPSQADLAERLRRLIVD